MWPSRSSVDAFHGVRLSFVSAIAEFNSVTASLLSLAADF